MPQTIPVIGVFWNELDDLRSWMRDVSEQCGDDIRVKPILVKCFHCETDRRFKPLIQRLIEEESILAEDVIQLSTNAGPTAAFNVGFLHARRACPDATWLATLDPDARLGPSALKQMLDNDDVQRFAGVTPVVLRSRASHDTEGEVTDADKVCHCGHFPKSQDAGGVLGIKHRWLSNFHGAPALESIDRMNRSPDWQPFSICFNAALWRMSLFDEIGLPDARQFRTLNCGEICYRARLLGKEFAISPRAVAFHPIDEPGTYAASVAINRPGSTSWHYQHARALIALKYFPDSERPKPYFAAMPNWSFMYPDLIGVPAEFDDDSRNRVFARWGGFQDP